MCVAYTLDNTSLRRLLSDGYNNISAGFINPTLTDYGRPAQ